MRNSLKIQTLEFKVIRSSKVINLGTNRKRICIFLLVTSNNFVHISYRFRVIDTFSSKIAGFPTPYLTQFCIVCLCVVQSLLPFCANCTMQMICYIHQHMRPLRRANQTCQTQMRLLRNSPVPLPDLL